MSHRASDNSDNKTNQKMAGALRIFGALSGAEEGYLDASERDNGVGGTVVLSGMTRFIHRYGGLAAAVLCIAVLGVSYLSFRIGVFPQSAEYGGAAVTQENMCVADSALSEAQEERAAGTEAPEEAAAKDTTAEENGYYANDSGASGEKETEAEKSEKLNIDVAEEKNVVTGGLSGTPADSRAEMRLAEAEALPVVGAYLPEAWPADGRIESVKGSDASGEESVSVTWTYGNQWDSFFVTVSNLGTALPVGLQETVADISKPETYDRRLYDIPYADTVPAEYIAVFLDPVFREEDFTRECVEARILPQKGDRGDTDTPRGNFRVLYRAETGEYVLAHFNGRGSVEDVWRVMRSINYFAQYEPWQKPPAL